MGDLGTDIYYEWPHAPSHLFSANSFYMVTAGTYRKVLLFKTSERLDYLMKTLFEEARRFQWQLHAWAIMANHYHFVAKAPEDAETLKDLIRTIHSKTARWINESDQVAGRKVWFQYWDTCLTYERSYLARLHYVNYNPVWHGLTGDAEHYRWCSMGWFVRNAKPGFRHTVDSFKIDRLNVEDNF